MNEITAFHLTIKEIRKYYLPHDYARIEQFLYGWNGVYIYDCDELIHS